MPNRPGPDVKWLLPAVLLVLAAASEPSAAPLPQGARYVAMGSSFASGPGVTTSADTPPDRCTRSADNYAQQLARKRGLRLVDVSCGGAASVHLLEPWRELPAQVDALTPDTALVTVTVGGNDLGYILGLMRASCDGAEAAGAAAEVLASACWFRPAGAPRTPPAAPTEDTWRRMEAGLDRIAEEVRRRAPAARLVFVDYLRVLPEGEPCAALSLPPAAAEAGRATAERLAQATARAAARAGAGLVRASELSRGHDACAADPWMTGFLAPPGGGRFYPYHPNLAGMSAVAEALDEQLGR